MNYWVGVVSGMCASVILFICLMFSVIAQNNDLKAQIKNLEVKVDKHEEIMRAYEFYNWKMSFQEKGDYEE